jgi:hypothetical protein
MDSEDWFVIFITVGIPLLMVAGVVGLIALGIASGGTVLP